MSLLATTLRLPADLKSDCDAYAESLGISLNALCAVALRDYLTARQLGAGPLSSFVEVQPESARVEGALLEAKAKATATAARKRRVAQFNAAPVAPVVCGVPDGGVYAPCPCGSGKKWKWCHGQA